MTDRYEQEVDTTHAYDLWQQEVEENMAARQNEKTAEIGAT